jgi:hypothetical protein
MYPDSIAISKPIGVTCFQTKSPKPVSPSGISFAKPSNPDLMIGFRMSSKAFIKQNEANKTITLIHRPKIIRYQFLACPGFLIPPAKKIHPTIQ